ncbi:MAG: exonuclease SbcCD subunit D [Oscillospiraceae bacterium]|nr:exonuclease SbcCD subunit D [Oscillospiraceae bacterium]MDY6209101.1 exonuclease SbcCD subunit D [Oscillospiraceae bacterium]
MKFIHLSDLHLGIRVNEFSMTEDQRYILERITGIIDREKPDGIIIAGDIYDKTVPPAEAVAMFDDFISGIAKRNIQTFIISGNHDSAERVSFGSRIMDASGIHFSPVYNGNISPIVMEDEFGRVNVYMLPFLRPSAVRAFFPDEDTDSYSSAVETAVRHLEIDPSERNILVTHQFVTGALRSDSEEVSVGGTDNVSADIFSEFDYTALGHIHRPQNIGSERIRYCGTPLKYSFSEAGHKKSVTIAELGAKGDLSVRTEELIPLREMVILKGSYEELMSKSFYEGTSYTEDYVHIFLTDESDVPDAVSKLRMVYRNLMKMDYGNSRTRRQNIISGAAEVKEIDPVKLFGEFFETQNNIPLSEEQAAFAENIIKEAWGDIK